MYFVPCRINFLIVAIGLCMTVKYLQHAPVQNLYSSSNTGEDFSKKDDRRSLIHRVCTTCTSYACARPELDTKTIYYEDTFNDEPWGCTFGTGSEDGVWVNFGDQVGTVMGSMVWVSRQTAVLE